MSAALFHDVRLELDGVLKSWAVQKGHLLNSKEKRLAILVDDHPLAYRTYEGVIAEACMEQEQSSFGIREATARYQGIQKTPRASRSGLN